MASAHTTVNGDQIEASVRFEPHEVGLWGEKQMTGRIPSIWWAWSFIERRDPILSHDDQIMVLLLAYEEDKAKWCHPKGLVGTTFPQIVATRGELEQAKKILDSLQARGIVRVEDDRFLLVRD